MFIQPVAALKCTDKFSKVQLCGIFENLSSSAVKIIVNIRTTVMMLTRQNLFTLMGKHSLPINV